MASEEPRYARAYFEAAERFGDRYGRPLPKRLLHIGSHDSGWGVTLNPTNERIGDVEPFNMHITWGGFPAGTIDPFGGIIAAGEAANEATFIKWLELIKE